MMFKPTTKHEIDSNTDHKSGIYKIYWIKNGKRQTISRIGGVDTNGLLYIGHTKGSLQNRLNQFRCSAFINSTNHSGALKYRRSDKLNALINKEDIFVEIEKCNSTLTREKHELKQYADEFGEVPPLNG